MIFVSGSHASCLLMATVLSMLTWQDKKTANTLDGTIIPNAYWVLESISQEGKETSAQEVVKINQVLVLQGEHFFLSRNGLPDYYGTIDYKPNREDKNQTGIVNFRCINPKGGGVKIHMARFRLLTDSNENRSKNSIRMELTINRSHEYYQRASKDSKKSGIVTETYVLQ